jgi:hypothetical protein
MLVMPPTDVAESCFSAKQILPDIGILKLFISSLNKIHNKESITIVFDCIYIYYRQHKSKCAPRRSINPLILKIISFLFFKNVFVVLLHFPKDYLIPLYSHFDTFITNYFTFNALFFMRLAYTTWEYYKTHIFLATERNSRLNGPLKMIQRKV